MRHKSYEWFPVEGNRRHDSPFNNKKERIYLMQCAVGVSGITFIETLKPKDWKAKYLKIFGSE